MPPEARTAAINQLKGLLVTAPASLREALEGRSTAALAAACARLRPEETALADPVDATKAALRVVACRIHQLDEEIGVADQRLATLVGRAAPRLLKLHAIGVDHAGQLLTTTGQRPERLRSERRRFIRYGSSGYGTVPADVAHGGIGQCAERRAEQSAR